MTPPFQVAVLFEETGLDGDSSSNVARLARVLVRDALRQGIRLKDGVKLSEALTPDPVVHNSLGDPTSFWGAFEAVHRTIDPKRLRRFVKKLLSRILAPDGTPISPETFHSAPTM